MKIIKHGMMNEIETSKRFECDTCKCIFEAEKGEYEISILFGWLENVRLYSCKCPECSSNCSLIEYIYSKEDTNDNL